MKKFILSAVAAGALAVGGAASAQDLGGVIGSIFGFGSPPATVQPGSVYFDQYGRKVLVDQFGRHRLLQSTVGIVGYDAWGRPVYGNIGSRSGNAAVNATVLSAQTRDNDGDGVPNAHDRMPNDANVQ